jgi:hypothetical protein
MAKKAYLGKSKKLIEDWVTGIYLEDKKVSAKKALEIVNARLVSKKHRPISLSTVSAFLTKLHQKTEKGELESPLDTPWSIGSCMEYGIPAQMIPVLNVIQKSRQTKAITIREARWFSTLHPMIGFLTQTQLHTAGEVLLSLGWTHFPERRKELESSKEKPLKIDEGNLRLSWLMFTGRHYAMREQINWIRNPKAAFNETYDLDQIFANPDLSIEQILDIVMNNISTSEDKTRLFQFISNFKNLKPVQLEYFFGKLTPEEVNWAGDFVEALKEGHVGVSKWIEKYPKESDVIMKKMEAQSERLNNQTR